MFFYEGLSCPHCQRRFLESDDIVACPVCGAPHHRGCWGDAGGCACREDHGTDKQWSRDTAKVDDPAASSSDLPRCPRCGEVHSPFAEMCARCGHPLNAQDWHSSPKADSFSSGYAPAGDVHEYAPFHTTVAPCGNVNPKEEIEGEAAEDLAAVVRTNATYYIPRFQRLGKTGSKVSWNWAAFLIPHIWFLFRKQTLAGIVALVFEILYVTVNDLIMQTILSPALTENAFGQLTPDYEAMYQLLASDERALLAAMLVTMLTTAYIIYHVFVGLFGTRMYMTDCLKKIRRTRESYPEGYKAQLSMAGGTSFVLGFIGFMVWQLLPSLILVMILL